MRRNRNVDFGINTNLSALTVSRNLSAAQSWLAMSLQRLEYAIANLQNASTNLSASRSRIQDADFAQETARLSRGQCIDLAESAQIKLLKHKPQQGSSCSAPGEGAGGYRSRSNPR